MKLTERMLRLIAVGASISASCQPCLQTNAALARESGADEHEIAEAIWVGALVKLAVASNKDRIASKIDQTNPISVNLPDRGCTCVQKETECK